MKAEKTQKEGASRAIQREPSRGNIVDNREGATKQAKMIQGIQQYKSIGTHFLFKDVIQKKVEAKIKNGPKTATGISGKPHANFSNCPELEALFDQNVEEKTVYKSDGKGGQEATLPNPRPRGQCAEPHALAKYINTYKDDISTLELEGIRFVSIKDDRNEGRGYLYDILPCAVCEQWITTEKKLSSEIIPQGLKSVNDIEKEQKEREDAEILYKESYRKGWESRMELEDDPKPLSEEILIEERVIESIIAEKKTIEKDKIGRAAGWEAADAIMRDLESVVSFEDETEEQQMEEEPQVEEEQQGGNRRKRKRARRRKK